MFEKALKGQMSVGFKPLKSSAVFECLIVRRNYSFFDDTLLTRTAHCQLLPGGENERDLLPALIVRSLFAAYSILLDALHSERRSSSEAQSDTASWLSNLCTISCNFFSVFTY